MNSPFPVSRSPPSSLLDVFVIVDFAEETSFILQSKTAKRDQNPCHIKYGSSYR